MMNSSDKNTLHKLRAYLEHMTRINNVFEDNDLFYLIVDTGCSITVTPYKDDFIEYIKYKEPITLKRIRGNLKVTHRGIAKYQVINTKGQVTEMYTLAHHNPNLDIRLFSPQAHFKEIKDKEKSFEVSSDKDYLNGKRRRHN